MEIGVPGQQATLPRAIDGDSDGRRVRWRATYLLQTLRQLADRRWRGWMLIGPLRWSSDAGLSAFSALRTRDRQGDGGGAGTHCAVLARRHR